jgi:hypothetical protein
LVNLRIVYDDRPGLNLLGFAADVIEWREYCANNMVSAISAYNSRLLAELGAVVIMKGSRTGVSGPKYIA